MLIDNSKDEYKDMPTALNGQVLIERPKAGGYITINPEYFKWFSEHGTPEEISAAGLEGYTQALNDIKDMDIESIEPSSLTKARAVQ